jgi:hypothetical protein
MSSEDAMRALMSIEGFRSLNSDIETIINLSDSVKKAKSKGEKLTDKEKKTLTDEEKEYKSKRKQIQEKLIKFATRIPVFMFLTDYREYSLTDVITQLEPGLFRRVTGLTVKDFELLVSLGVFNASLMNDAIYKFRRYEDSSINYTGIDRHENEAVGGYDTVLTAGEYDKLYGSQQGSLTAVTQAISDLQDTDFEIDSDDEDEDEDVIPKPKPVQKAKPSVEAPSPVRTIIAPQTKPAPKINAPSAPKKTTEKPKVDVSGVKVGGTVKHKSFGDGIVTKIADGRIMVKFTIGEKLFQFPQAFDGGFLW